jgi:hypothetical protein
MMLVNGPAWDTGKIGRAVASDGVNDYMTVPMIDLSGTSAVTVALWVNRTYSAGPAHTLIELSTDFNSTNAGFGLFPDDTSACGTGQIMLGVDGDAGYSINCFTQPSSGVWHHLVAIYDKSQPGTQETALYIDGSLQTVTLSPFTNDNTNNFGALPLYVFSRGGTLEFNVNVIDEIVIYARALTPAEVAQL